MSSRPKYEPLGPRPTYRRAHPRDPDFEYQEIRRRDILIVACYHVLFPTSLDPDIWKLIGYILASKFSYTTEMDGQPFSVDWVRGRYEQLKQTEDEIYLEWKDLQFYSPQMTDLRRLECLRED